MSTFLRLAVPTYFGGLPSGYGYINNAVSGTPANADGQKSGGPNAGTYFIGFGENATSADANRPAAALALNTDYLDNLFHQDLAVPQRTSNVTSAGDTSITVASNMFVGVSGTPNTPAGILSFAKVLDQNEDEIVTPGGTTCAITAISGATVGTGFATGSVTLTISPAIPAGVVYHLWYATRGNLATLPVDALTNVTIRTTQELPAGFEDFQQQISRFSGTNVAALVATDLETPNGTRLAKSAFMAFDVNPDGSTVSIGGNTGFVFRGSRDTGSPYTIAQFLMDNTPVYTGVSGRLALTSGTIEDFGGHGGLHTSDMNTNMSGLFLPYSGSTAGVGDDVPRFAELAPTVANGITTVPSLFKTLNGRLSVTVGDGTISFGDFSGPEAIQAAVAFIQSKAAGLGHVYVKGGNYTFNAAFIVLNSGTPDIIIEGVARGACKITSTAASSYLFSNTVAGYLECRNLSITNTGSFATFFCGNGGYLRIRNCSLVGSPGLSLGDFGVSASVAGPLGVLVEDSLIDTTACAINLPPVRVQITRGALSTSTSPLVFGSYGMHFDRCTFKTQDDTAVIRFFSTTSAAVLGGVLFDQCQIALGKATLNGSTLNGAAGVFDFNSGSAGLFVLDDIEWRDCRVLAGVDNTGGTATSLLARILPNPLNTTGGNTGIINRVTIRGGTWTCPNEPTYFNPLTIAAGFIDIEDAVFTATSLGNGTFNPEVSAVIYGGSTPSVHDWSAFVLAPSAVTPSVGRPNGMSLKNVTFTGFGRDTVSGDVTLHPAPDNNSVDGLLLTGYVDTNNSLTLPYHRFKIWNVSSTATTFLGCGGSFDNITVNVGVNSTSGEWLDDTAGNHVEGYFKLANYGPCVVRNPKVIGGQHNSTLVNTGIRLSALTSLSGYAQASGARVINGRVRGCATGLRMTTAGSGSGTMSDVTIQDGSYDANGGSGISIDPDSMRDVRVFGVRASGNGSPGIYASTNWVSSGLRGRLALAGNYCENNNGGGTNPQIQVTAASGSPAGSAYGNTCVADTSGTPGYFTITTPGTTSDYNTWDFHGVETSIHATGNTNNLDYAHAAPMMHNNALLT